MCCPRAFARFRPSAVRGGLDPAEELRVSDAQSQSFWVVGPDLRFSSNRPALQSTEMVGERRTYPVQSLVAQVMLEFVLRRIESGKEFYDEGEQGVTLLTGRHVSCQTVLRVDQLIPPLFVVKPDLRSSQAGETVNVLGPVSTDKTILAFTDLETARAVARWMSETHPTRLGALRLEAISGRPRFYADRLRPEAAGDPCRSRLARPH
jgi:hypothetical protein